MDELGVTDYDGLTLNEATPERIEKNYEGEDVIVPAQEEYYSMSTMPIVSCLINAVKEQQDQIADLLNIVKGLTDINENLTARIEKLENKGFAVKIKGGIQPVYNRSFFDRVNSMPEEKLNLVVVIMAGGAGTRFWPLSTEEKPKQFLNLFFLNIDVSG